MSFTATLLTFLYIMSEWAIRIIMTVVIPFRRSADAARSWLLLVFFLPWPALFLYLFIGRPTLPEWRKKRFKELPEVMSLSSAHITKIVEAAEIPNMKEDQQLLDAAKFIQNSSLLPIVGNSSVELIDQYQEVTDRLIYDIDQAKQHVHLLYYIFADDETGHQVMDALIRAAQRRVICRVLIDAIGSRKWFQAVKEKLTPHGISVQEAFPVSFFKRKSARADLRNHCKIAVIDSSIAYVGSQNIINADFAPGIKNKELVTRLGGPVTLELQTLFIMNWFLETKEKLSAEQLLVPTKKTGNVICQVLPSGPDYDQFGIEHLLVAMLYAARKRVVITTPYFVPSDSLITAMQIAVMRGVEVHLVVSDVTDHKLVKWAQCSYYEEMLRIGVQIHCYKKDLLHAKHFSIDDRVAVIGSSNVDLRSFILNSEVMVVYFDKEVVQELYKIQTGYFENSYILNEESWQNRPLHNKICENLARMVGAVL